MHDAAELLIGLIHDGPLISGGPNSIIESLLTLFGAGIIVSYTPYLIFINNFLFLRI